MAAGSSHDRFRHLLAAYAVGGLDDASSGEVEGHLARCGTCRTELRGFQEAVVRLASEEEPPPAAVWPRIADRLFSPGEGGGI